MESNLKVAELEKKRIENLKNLGYMCFNLLIGNDNAASTDFVNKMYEMKGCFNRIELLRRTGTNPESIARYLKTLDDKAVEMGCLCYNSYVDRNSANKNISDYCITISELNNKILNEKNLVKEDKSAFYDLPRSEVYTDKEPQIENKTENKIENKTVNNGFENVKSNNVVNNTTNLNNEEKVGLNNNSAMSGADSVSGAPVKNNTEENKGVQKIKVDYPYGMEPIPVNAKVCVCGYRNREYARFCGKCGAKI
jgi:hypothetical protein